MGLWIMEMASDFPESTFIGIDKSETFPTSGVPSNAKFMIMDSTKPWPFKDGTFDLVGQRSLMADYKVTDWPFVLKETLRCLKPGGWIQFSEPHVTSKRSSERTVKFCEFILDSIALQGCDGLIYKELPRLLVEAGFQEIEEFVISIPFGSWGGTAGTLIKDDAAGWAFRYKQQLVSLLNLDVVEYDKNVDALLTDCETYKSYVSFSVFLAQKPC
jgi:SAM-dependent methyltransferase